MNLKSTLYAAKQLLRPGPKHLTLELQNVERKSAEEIRLINWQRRMDLLASAAKTPFYRKRFADIGLEVGDVKGEKDWERIPVLTRQDVQEHLEEMVRDDVDRTRLGMATTGGSTGQPLKLYRPKGLPFDAFTDRMLGWWGVNMWENSCYIFRHGYNGWRKTVNDLMWWPTKREFLNAANMDDEKCAEFYECICKIEPKLLVGYVGAVSNFAEYLVRAKKSLPFKMKAAWTTSAPLPEPLRANLQSVFGCPVYSQYGCCEVAHLAAECACQKGMHIHSDWRHLEIVDDHGVNVPVGESGRVLVTDMLVPEVPLIRYALGDSGRLMKEKCACGNNLPLMAPVSGRVSEGFLMPDGSRLSGDYLTTIFDKYPDAIRGFRVHQRKDYSIDVEYIPRDAGTLNTALEDAKRNLGDATKKQVEVRFVPVEMIPHDRGKTRYVTSEVMA